MAVLIDRDALLKDLRSECPESDVCFSHESCIECLVNRQPAVNLWILCSERLPEHDTMVIVCYYGSDCIFPMQGETVTEAIARQNKVPTVTMGFLTEEGWCGADMFPMMVKPTFWMNLPDAPLPEPPEKE